MARDRLGNVVSPISHTVWTRILIHFSLEPTVRVRVPFSTSRAQTLTHLLYLSSEQPTPGPTYPPPGNGVVAPTRNANPYAQQTSVAAAAPGGYGAQGGYGASAGNPYAQTGQAGNPYATGGQYGQQEQYAMGGANGGAGEDFWTELSNTNSLLSQLQEQIQAVRAAHQSSLVSVIQQMKVFYTHRVCIDRPQRTPRPLHMPLNSTTKLVRNGKNAKTKSKPFTSSPRTTVLKGLRLKVSNLVSKACCRNIR